MRWLLVIVTLLAVYVGYTFIDRFDPEMVRGKKVLVTGASTGIGEQIAYHYARMGASVFITSRREGKLKEVVSRCGELGDGDFHYMAADMGNMDDTHHVVNKAAETLGGLDILVLNHIIASDLGEWTGNQANYTMLQKIFNVNFHAYVHLASTALPHLKTRNGSIVVVSSLSGKIGTPYTSAYSGSKFALDGFFSGLRIELNRRSSGVSVTLCVIGLIKTDNAISQLKKVGANKMLETISPSSPVDTALAIIKGGALREREIYFPYLECRFMCLIRDWFPALVEYMFSSVWEGV